MRQVVKNAIYLSRRKFDVFSPKKIASYSDLEQKDFRLSVKMLFGGQVKTAFNLSRKNFFIRKIVLFKSFSLFNEIFSAFYSKIFTKFVRTAFFVSGGTSCGFFAEKKTLRVLDLNWNIISTMAKISWQAWQNWILSVHENLLKLFDSAKKKLFFSCFPDIRRNQGDVLKKYFQQDCQNGIFGFRRNTLIGHIPWRS